MVLKDQIQSLFCFILKNRKKEKGKIKKEKQIYFLKIEIIIIRNGFLASKLFLFPQKIIIYLKLIDFFVFNDKRNSKIYWQTKTSLYLGRTINKKNAFDFIKNMEPRASQLGQLIFIEGIIIRIAERKVKKFKENDFLFLDEKSNIRYKSKNTKFSLEKNQLVSLKAIDSIADYQEAKIFYRKKNIFGRRETLNFEILNVFFTGRMVDTCKIGEKVSLWGVLKCRSINKIISKIRHQIDYSLEVISLHLKKEIDIEEKSSTSQKSKIIDFSNIWNDCKIRGKVLATRNKIIKNFLPTFLWMPLLKIIILMTITGSCPYMKGLKLPGNLILGISGDCIFRKGKILKDIFTFWKNSFFFTKNEIISKNGLIEMKKNFNKTNSFLKIIEKIMKKPIIGCISNFPDFITERVFFLKNRLNNFVGTFISPKNFLEIKITTPLFLTLESRSILSLNFFDEKTVQKPNRDKNIRNLSIKYFQNFDFLYFFPKNFKKAHIIEIYDFVKNIFPPRKFKKKNFFRIFSNQKWFTENIRNSIKFSKSFFCPKYSHETERILTFWYAKWKPNRETNQKRILFLEKIINLAQAHSRLLWQEKVLPQDCLLSLLLIQNIFDTTKTSRMTGTYFDSDHNDDILIDYLIKNIKIKIKKNIENSGENIQSLCPAFF